MNSLNNSLRMNYKRGETDMTIKIYDTMTRSLRDFVPITENTVNMYVCGPTVYNYIHIGNARSVVAFDTIRRYLNTEATRLTTFLTSQMLMTKSSKELLKLVWTPKLFQINLSPLSWKMSNNSV